MGKKSKREDTSVKKQVTKEFDLCRDTTSIKRSKEEGISFFQNQLLQAQANGDRSMIIKLEAILNRLTGGRKNGLRIEPERIRRRSK